MDNQRVTEQQAVQLLQQSNGVCHDLPSLAKLKPASDEQGDSMIEAGVYGGDVLVVDRSVDAEHGDIVVAAVGNEFTVKELCTRPSLMLLPRNPAYKPIRPRNGEELNIFGVVTNVIRQMKRK